MTPLTLFRPRSFNLPFLVPQYPPIEGPHLKWNSAFPLRSVTALRVALLDLKTVPAIYRAAWRDDKDISDDGVLIQVLNANGFNGQGLVLSATTGPKAEVSRLP